MFLFKGSDVREARKKMLEGDVGDPSDFVHKG